MTPSRYRPNLRRCSIGTTQSKHRSTKRRHANDPPTVENFQGMRGKMSSNCLWHACQALFVGLVLFSIGAIMSTLGFQADGLLSSNATEATTTYDLYNDSRTNVRFSKLSYAGPIVMGVGAFIIVSVCVMTFEARDSASKVGPASYSSARATTNVYTHTYRARPRTTEVRSVASQTIAEAPSSNSSSAIHLFDKKSFLETFRKFSRYKTIRTGSTCKDEEDQFHRSPSAPNLAILPASTLMKCRNEQLQNTPTSSHGENLSRISALGSILSARRTSVLAITTSKLKSHRTGGGGPPPLKHLRQVMSMDCPSGSPFIVSSVVSDKQPSTSSSSSNVVPVNKKLVKANTKEGSLDNHPSCSFTSEHYNPMSPDNISIKSSSTAKFKEYKNSPPAPVSAASLPTNSTNFFNKSDCCVIIDEDEDIEGDLATETDSKSNNSEFITKVELKEHHHSTTNLSDQSISLASTNKQVASDDITYDSSTSSSKSIVKSEVVVESSFSGKLKDENERRADEIAAASYSGSSSAGAKPRITSSMSVVEIESTSSGYSNRRPKLCSELSCRPMLMRQSRVVDQSDIISIPDDDEDAIQDLEQVGKSPNKNKK